MRLTRRDSTSSGIHPVFVGKIAVCTDLDEVVVSAYMICIISMVTLSHDHALMHSSHTTVKLNDVILKTRGQTTTCSRIIIFVLENQKM